MSKCLISAAALAQAVGGELVGADVELERPCTLDNPKPRALGFIKTPDALIASRLQNFEQTVFLVPQGGRGVLSGPHIIVENPRGAFARALHQWFSPQSAPRIAATAVIAADAQLGIGVTVGDFSVIGPGVSVGAGTEIRHHVVVGRGVVIGERCLIKSNTVIGEEGFGIDRDERGNNLRVPHLGSVVIGNDVEIGALNTVCAGTIDPTTISDFVKTDDHVHIAHNCNIGKNTIITACAELSGSVTLGDDVWLAPNCSILNGITIGNRVFIGLGAVVLKNCDANGVYAGTPAKKIRERSATNGTAS